MNLCLRIVILTIIIRATLEECTSINTYHAGPEDYEEDFYPSTRFLPKKYIHCENIHLSGDFLTTIKPLFQDARIEWLEISDTTKPEIGSGAFKTRHSLPGLRIEGTNIQIIQSEAFVGLFNLTRLSLKKNKIYWLDANCFRNLTNLVKLDLSLNNIADLNENIFVALPKLRHLYLHNNFITSLSPNLFQNTKELEDLDLGYNQIRYIDDKLFVHLANLTNLWLNNNILIYFPDILSNNSNLKHLNLHHNSIRTLDFSSFPNSLKMLNISYNLHPSLNFKKFVDIQIIDLSGNDFAKISVDFFKQFCVRELYLGNNHLGIFNSSLQRETFTSLTDLETISLKNNRFEKLEPDLFKNNNKLKTVDLSKNSLTGLLWLPPLLQNLNLNSNNFNSRLKVANYTNLTTLDISFNNLNELQFYFLDGLTELQKLNLRNNQIREISLGCFHDLRKLVELDLSYNKITNLEIGVFVGLDHLDRLDISHNQLSVLNEGVFHNLEILRVMDIGYNNLSFISAENTLSHLKWLREIALSGNNWSCSLLIQIRKEYLRLKFTDGGNHNVTNVNGIGCTNDLNITNSFQTDNALILIRAKIDTTNNLLILILLVLVVTLLLKYLPTYTTKCKINRAKSEQEIQLVNTNIV